MFHTRCLWELHMMQPSQNIKVFWFPLPSRIRMNYQSLYFILAQRQEKWNSFFCVTIQTFPVLTSSVYVWYPLTVKSSCTRKWVFSLQLASSSWESAVLHSVGCNMDEERGSYKVDSVQSSVDAFSEVTKERFPKATTAPQPLWLLYASGRARSVTQALQNGLCSQLLSLACCTTDQISLLICAMHSLS